MAQAVEPDRGAPSVTFEVERFEAEGRDRMALSGRWYGLRGRRFVRPMLTLGTGSNRRRALADLEHKPWAAHDGELWEATFQYEQLGGDLGKFELTVAPDVTVALPEPGSGASEQRIRALPRRDDLLDNLRGARRDGRPRPGSGNGADSRRAGRSATRWEDGSEAQREAPQGPQTQREAPQVPQTQREAPQVPQTQREAPQVPQTQREAPRVPQTQTPRPVSATGPDGAQTPRPTRRRSTQSPDLAQRLSRAQQEIERLRAELTRQEGARVEAAAVLNRRDAAGSRLSEAIAARDQALRARDEAVRARDQALRDRDRAIAKSNKLSEAAAAHRSAAPPAVARSRAVTSPWVMWTQRVLAVTVLVVVVLAFAITARLV